MDNSTSDDEKPIQETELFYRSSLLDRVENLQHLAEKRDLIVTAYSRVQLSTLDNAELKMYCTSLHELLYSPPPR